MRFKNKETDIGLLKIPILANREAPFTNQLITSLYVGESKTIGKFCLQV